MMTFRLNKSILSAAVIAACSIPAYNANAGGTITFGEDKSVSVGFGMRGSFSSLENGATNGDRSSDFSLDSARLFLSGSLNKYIKGTLNTERSGAGDTIQVIDAIAQFELQPEFNIWAGRMLSPSDRANLAGSYYSLGLGYWTAMTSRYGANAGVVGRDDGVTVWGNVLGGKMTYSLGAFEGHKLGIGSIAATTVGAPTTSDDLMYAGRLQYDFWDPEPGYYVNGNYQGTKDILAIGIAGRVQKDGVLTLASKGDYSSYNVDFLLEKTGIGPGAVSVEAAYYDYNTDGIILSEQGKAYSGALAYIFNDQVGWGKIQPFTRFQKFDADAKVVGSAYKQYDLGANYIIDGYNAIVSATYSNSETQKTATSTTDIDKIIVALQVQF